MRWPKLLAKLIPARWSRPNRDTPHPATSVRVTDSNLTRLSRQGDPQEIIPQLHLIRDSTGHQGTLGRLLVNGVRIAWSLEPPWRANRVNASSIPPGTYLCRWHLSPSKGWVYRLEDVPGRTNILIHSGNYGADKSAGHLKTNTIGCILLGRRRGTLGGQLAVLISKFAVRDLSMRMGQHPFLLTIEERYAPTLTEV